MPLNATALSADIKAGLLSNEASSALDNGSLQAMCDEIAIAVINHFVANTVVLPTALVAPSGGGPVTGTGTIQ